MNLHGQSKLLRIFIGESDRIGYQALYEAIVLSAKERNMAGATAIKGIMSFGASSHIHVARLIEIAEDLPVLLKSLTRQKRLTCFFLS